MYHFVFSVLAFILFFVPCEAQSQKSVDKQQNLKNMMLADLDSIKNAFISRYAPYEWKNQLFDWNLEKEIQLAKNKVRTARHISIRDYHTILKAFCNSTRDYHVHVEFYSTAASFLPFRIKKAESRYFFTWLNEKKVPSSFEIGDELLLFDGKPIDACVQAIKSTGV